jgi:hypothetical protein
MVNAGEDFDVNRWREIAREKVTFHQAVQHDLRRIYQGIRLNLNRTAESVLHIVERHPATQLHAEEDITTFAFRSPIIGHDYRRDTVDDCVAPFYDK